MFFLHILYLLVCALAKSKNRSNLVYSSSAAASAMASRQATQKMFHANSAAKQTGLAFGTRNPMLGNPFWEPILY